MLALSALLCFRRIAIGTRRISHASAAVLRERSSASLMVSEMFTSVQGEGPFVGRPSIFVRLGRCNLSCVWCDTPYTWLYTEKRREKVLNAVPNALHDTVPAVHDRDKELQRWSAGDLVSAVLERGADAGAGGVRAVVVTGGEPLLHARPLQHVIGPLVDAGYAVEFETNGTLSPTPIHPAAHFNVSPKLANSYNSERTRLNYPVLHEFAQRNACFKFVVDNEKDIEELVQIVQKVAIQPDRVYLMPQGTSSESIRERGRWLVEQCLKYGFRYSHRVHVELWGDKRGV